MGRKEFGEKVQKNLVESILHFRLKYYSIQGSLGTWQDNEKERYDDLLKGILVARKG